MESWKGEGGDAADAGAVVGSCPQQSEGRRRGEVGKQRSGSRFDLVGYDVAVRRREKKAHTRGPGSRTPMCAGRATAHEKRMGDHDPAQPPRTGAEKISVKKIGGYNRRSNTRKNGLRSCEQLIAFFNQAF